MYLGSAAPQKANGNMTSPRNNKRKIEAISGSSSSLSPASAVQSPRDSTLAEEVVSPRNSRAPSCSSIDSHQPPPAPSIAQYPTFGSDPLTFDDPTIYHIREVTSDLTEEEKKEIYCVAQFPHDDLSHLIAGTPPDKDFSNAKPTNQVNANTFAAYIEPYLRPLTEEDMAFLKERVSGSEVSILLRFQADEFVRVIAQLRLLCRVVANAITLRFGQKRMAIFCLRAVIKWQTNCLQIRAGAAWNK